MNHPWAVSDRVFDVLIGGKSILDIENAMIGKCQTQEEANLYLESYGFDAENSVEMAELQGHLHEAIEFIQKKFLMPGNPDGLGSEIPRKILENRNVHELLKLVSRQDAEPILRAWACSILKVVHIITHMDRDVRNYYFTEIQKQILDRFYGYLQRDSEGGLYLGKSENDPLRVNLVEFQVKPKKPRESTLIKLLQKPENVAEELFDRVGVRYVTANRVDAVRVIHFLEINRVLVSANIKPLRSRNTLLDAEWFREALYQGLLEVEGGRMELAELGKVLDTVPTRSSKEENPFTSEYYRSIQFTGRQLIKIQNSLVDRVRDLKLAAKKIELPEAFRSLIEQCDGSGVPKTVRFFYPFEVQVVDQKGHLENEKGRSAHSEYKRAQLEVAARRVLRGVIRAFE